jgi:hypothetical protein
VKCARVWNRRELRRKRSLRPKAATPSRWRAPGSIAGGLREYGAGDLAWASSPRPHALADLKPVRDLHPLVARLGSAGCGCCADRRTANGEAGIGPLLGQDLCTSGQTGHRPDRRKRLIDDTVLMLTRSCAKAASAVRRTPRYQIEDSRKSVPMRVSVVANGHSVLTGSACPNSVMEREGGNVLVTITIQLEEKVPARLVKDRFENPNLVDSPDFWK